MIDFNKLQEQYCKKMKIPYKLSINVHVFYINEPRSNTFTLDFYERRAKLIYYWNTNEDIIQNVYNYTLLLGACYLALKGVHINFTKFNANEYKTKLGKYLVFDMKKYYDSVSNSSQTK
ncbi:MAG: hypothetical protein QW156_04855 [Candidatus Aenigmatarchaeota archaeon]